MFLKEPQAFGSVSPAENQFAISQMTSETIFSLYLPAGARGLISCMSLLLSLQSRSICLLSC